MKYEPNRQKLSNYFFGTIFPKMDNFGVDYNKLVSSLMNEVGISKKIVVEFIESLIQSGKLNEFRTLELTKEEIKRREEEVIRIKQEAESIIKGELPQEIEEDK